MFLENAWYTKSRYLYLLWPVSIVFRLFATLRRLYWQKIARDKKSPVAVIVVGNISVGGTGKTPLVMALARLLQQQGLQPGIILRGYKGKASHYPLVVTAATSVAEAGDEAVLIARQLTCPVVVDANRRRARDALVQAGTCNIIISDDGLQHYALHRVMEIAVLDGERGIGNGLCLPAGPLREPVTRLRNVDNLILNGGRCDEWRGLTARCSTMQLRPRHWVNLKDGRQLDIAGFCAMLAQEHNSSKLIHALAGIGNPQRFFNSLATLGIQATPHVFPDHHCFSRQDIQFGDAAVVLMTEKDAVKCLAFADSNCWYLAVEAELTDDFQTWFTQRANGLLTKAS